MKTYSDYIWLKRQLIEMEEALSNNLNSPLMRLSLENRISSIREELETFGTMHEYDTTLRLWFGGKAVYGSIGIFSDFVSKTSVPLTNMITAKYTEIVSGKLYDSERGRVRGIGKEKMFISNVLHGSFGYEMGWVNDNLFSEQDASEAIEKVINIINLVAKDEENLEEALNDESPRTVSYLRKFYKTVSESSNILIMESGMIHTELSDQDLKDGYNRIKQTELSEQYLTIQARLSGIFTDSGTFEFLDEEGNRKVGSTNEDLDDEQLAEYARLFTNKECKLVIKEYMECPTLGKPKVTYELIQIQNK
ncbi:MAG: hypothetical protein IJM89_04725 [Bacteroidales bacterium]|nr:hypothetical protein [Bacteroidales bacterium]